MQTEGEIKKNCDVLVDKRIDSSRRKCESHGDGGDGRASEIAIVDLFLACGVSRWNRTRPTVSSDQNNRSGYREEESHRLRETTPR